VNDQTRLDDIIANYTDTILSGRDASVPEEFASEARIVQALNRVIAPSDGLDAAMRSRLNQRINAEWDQRKSRRSTLNFPASRFAPMAVAAGVAIVIGVVAIILSMGDTSGSDVSATAQGDGSALVIVMVMAAVALVGGFLFVLWNRRR
jgi:hypothetical protein